MIIQGRSGLLSITGTESGETVRVGSSIADIVSGLYAVIGVLAGLLRRERGGAGARGARVDIAMLDSVVSVLENALARYQATGVEPGPLGSRHPSITPFETFRTADGQIVIAAGNDRLFGASSARCWRCRIWHPIRGSRPTPPAPTIGTPSRPRWRLRWRGAAPLTGPQRWRRPACRCRR